MLTIGTHIFTKAHFQKQERLNSMVLLHTFQSKILPQLQTILCYTRLSIRHCETNFSVLLLRLFEVVVLNRCIGLMSEPPFFLVQWTFNLASSIRTSVSSQLRFSLFRMKSNFAFFDNDSIPLATRYKSFELIHLLSVKVHIVEILTSFSNSN